MEITPAMLVKGLTLSGCVSSVEDHGYTLDIGVPGIIAFAPSKMGYDGIPAKTGSDFDIDKMYVMAPNMMYNKKTMSLELITEENKQYYKGSQEKAKKLIAQNKVLNLYSDILQSPHTYDNMMTSIDSEFLKEDIMDLFPQPALKNLDLFSPVTQIQTRLMSSQYEQLIKKTKFGK